MAEGLLLCGLKLRFEFGGVNMNREEQVKRILLMPIIASKDIKGITLATRDDTKESFILSGHSCLLQK